MDLKKLFSFLAICILAVGLLCLNGCKTCDEELTQSQKNTVHQKK